jgi:hypothetical protein
MFVIAPFTFHGILALSIISGIVATLAASANRPPRPRPPPPQPKPISARAKRIWKIVLAIYAILLVPVLIACSYYH